jgi:hypothetical protein
MRKDPCDDGRVLDAREIMNEIMSPAAANWSPRGHKIGEDRLQRDAYELFAWNAAARQICAELPKEGEVLKQIAQTRGEGEASGPSYARLACICRSIFDRDLSPLLLGIAAMLRVKDEDGSWHLSNSGTNEERVSEIALLCDGPIFDIKVARSIGLRETCNKILHAQRVEVVTCSVTYWGDAFDIPTGTVVLVGKHREQDWIVRLNVEQYAIAALKTVF